VILVGVDAGASRCRVGVWRGTEELARATGPAAAIRPGRALLAAATIATQVKAALARLGLTGAGTLVVGAAGAGREADAGELAAALRREYMAERVIVTTDVMLALEALSGSARIALLAGTGSVALARRPDGGLVQQGGLGWQMGDEGGAYWIAREALAASGRAADGRGPATSLGPALERATASPRFRDLVGWAASAAPGEIAALAPVVAEAARAGDAVAGTILERAAAELAALADRLAQEIATHPAVVALGGSLLAEDGPLRARTAAAIGARGHVIAAGSIDPLEGARRLGSS
jgi:N-acetylglucosamine kinase-like BadF-type ATPase